jgi:DNA-binding NarL/FixJ family response regulator
MPPHIRVVVVDDHEVFLDALALCLREQPDIDVVATATSVRAAQRVVDDTAFDVLLLDLDLAGEDGLLVARQALSRHPEVAVLVTTGSDGSDQRIVEAVQLGVRGWMTKTVTASDLLEAIRGVARGETHIPAQLLTGVLMSLSQRPHAAAEHLEGIDELTSRELEVLGCLVDGMSRAAIGELLHVSPNTVRTHVQSILHKLKVHSALAAVAVARRAGVTGSANLTSTSV